MKRSPILVCAMMAVLLAADPASAQVIPPGGSIFNPPPPSMDPVPIPQMGVPIQQNYAPAPRPSFSDRITTCLDQAAAGGLDPGDRAAYSRSCANR